MSSAVTLPRKLVAAGADPSASTIAEPQSPSATRSPGPAETACPCTTRVATPEPSKPPLALAAFAVACTFPVIDVAVTSPPNSESELSTADALAVAVWPGLADAEATEEPQERTSGLVYEEGFPNDTASFGAETAAVAAPFCPGTITLIA